MPDSLRVLIYARGTPEEIAAQRAECMRLVDLLGSRDVVSVAADPPGGSDGWISANAMLADGVVDQIFVVSRGLIPNVIESVTQVIARAIPDRRPRRLRFD
jgi:hypothetical protein